MPTSSSVPVMSHQPTPTPLLSRYSYQERPSVQLHYVRNSTSVGTALQSLQGAVGFDLEWRPNFQKGRPDNLTALIQIADLDNIVLIQLSAMRVFPRELKAFLEDARIAKVGVNVASDALKLFNESGVRTKCLIDLATLARLVDFDRWPTNVDGVGMSLATLCETYLQRTLAKGRVQMSNWEAHLTQEQRDYAANDAHSAAAIYARLWTLSAEMASSPAVESYVFNVDESYVQGQEEEQSKRKAAKKLRRKEKKKAGKSAKDEALYGRIGSQEDANPSGSRLLDGPSD